MLIAQITDLHIRPEGQLVYRRVDTAAYLSACVAHLNALEPRPDVVLLTGDLVDSPKPLAYEHLRRLLAPLAIPYLVIPGNHDGREALRAAFADHGYLKQDEVFLHYVIDDYPLRLVGLDSTIADEEGGRLCDERLAWLDARLSDAPDRPSLLFIHHPPFATGLSYMDAYRLEPAEPFGRLVQHHPQIVGLLCGHVHRMVQTRWCGIQTTIAPSPAHAFALELAGRDELRAVLEPPACLLHHWTPDGGLLTHLSFIGDFAEVFRHALGDAH